MRAYTRGRIDFFGMAWRRLLAALLVAIAFLVVLGVRNWSFPTVSPFSSLAGGGNDPPSDMDKPFIPEDTVTKG